MAMEIDKVTEENLAVSKPIYTTNTKVKQRIREEEEYLSILDSIVERDFYPELTKMKLQNSYLDALEKNDLEMLREIQFKLEEGSALRREGSPKCFDVNDEEIEESCTKVKVKSQDLTLDEFLAKNTSEDNASFEKIMQVMREKHREKHAWLHEKQKLLADSLDKSLLLPCSSTDEMKNIDSKPNNVDTWKYQSRNALMYTPDGVDLSSEEYIEQKGKKEQEIRHENTRFKDDPFDCAASQTALVQAAQERANMQKAVGKVGVDGKLEAPGETPNVQGYSFVATPSPMPGANESPLMTWGAIEGTPLRLDATPAHNSQGPIFKIPEPPRREQIAHSLAEKASKQHREKRRRAFAAATASIFSPKTTPRSCGITLNRWSKLSPAAQKLMKSSVSIHTDNTLRASYTPSPGLNKKNSAIQTPNMNTPGSKRIKTPRSDCSVSTITDNLLDIPDT